MTLFPSYINPSIGTLVVNQFYATDFFLYLLKKTENLLFFMFSVGIEVKRVVEWNRLID